MNTPLTPGAYMGSVLAFSGAYRPGGGGNFSVSDNITGVNIQGQFSSFSQATPVMFTLTGP